MIRYVKVGTQAKMRQRGFFFFFFADNTILQADGRTVKLFKRVDFCLSFRLNTNCLSTHTKNEKGHREDNPRGR